MNFISNRGFQVNKNSPRHMLASACLTEDSDEGVLFPPCSLAIRLDAMFQAAELPAGTANLDTSLTNVDRVVRSRRRQKQTQGLATVSDS